MTATALFFTVMGRDIRLALRRPSDALYALFFFVVTATLFPLATLITPNLDEVNGYTPYKRVR